MSRGSNGAIIGRFGPLGARVARARASEDGAASTLRRAAGVFVVGVAAAVFALRLPAAFDGFAERAALNAASTPEERVLVVADSLDLDNDFVLEALELLPEDARYAFLLPATPEVAQTSYGMNEIAFVHAAGFMRYLLLPRRPVPPEAARWVLCYGCDTDPWDGRTAWLWKNENGAAVGWVRE